MVQNTPNIRIAAYVHQGMGHGRQAKCIECTQAVVLIDEQRRMGRWHVVIFAEATHWTPDTSPWYARKFDQNGKITRNSDRFPATKPKPTAIFRPPSRSPDTAYQDTRMQAQNHDLNRHVRLRRWLLASLLIACTVGAGAQALKPLPNPKDKVVLSITGRVANPNAGSKADFDMAMLEALPQHSFSTSTPWFKTPRTFSGPLLREVLAAAGAKGTALVAVALNDYKVEIPAEDTDRYGVVLATRLDGKPMLVREKGPLFIIYPYDDSADLRSERYYSRSAWQLRTLQVK
jgi:hypothetical protein